ncbi:hypothetical protein SYNTR_0439 [Candidatus Syntrophocurvum alkaliphilum]|uniref:Uncharacterized protein n=1 Tax=Candidatus Syntrophocurvum alkaliphilum TaxID=2293317 RepID=A0A6I6DE38_9FIRM|nr:hypothetical protein [Candidatus Syntrophocurvum alkaliphilum]QGT99032.1 hypothetical protein SYNTR_0439 [Candidatus Syntrophocurvum alkaliphilum]
MVENFGIKFIRKETHLALPTVTSIRLAQNLYDILFQYVINEEKESKLQEFIALLESHIKSKADGPFSIPISEISFLEDGLEELKLLNWMEVSVWIAEIIPDTDVDASLEYYENVFSSLSDYVKYKKISDNRILLYPYSLISY